MASAVTLPPKVIKIDITSDIICPWCFIGLKKIQGGIELAKIADPTLDFSIRFHPYNIDPTVPFKPTDKRTRWEQHHGGKERVLKIEQMLIEKGNEVGIKFSLGGNVSKTHNGHRLLELAFERGGEKTQLELMELLFKGYFENHQDPGDLSFLSKSAVEAGVCASTDEAMKFLLSKSLSPEVYNAYLQGQARGVSGVPFTIVEGTYGVSGAQDSETFAEIFAKVAKEQFST
ncbi:DSBA oxidoreductase [Mrakia frigida]|uniref:DsbA family oxidoreductase n=1 Tax=Mrakia frigida TaxID=29902 RepID=UPI003FCC2410